MAQVLRVFLSDTPDLSYQFAMICEHYRLAGTPESEALNDINDFFYPMSESIAKGLCPHLKPYDSQQGYDGPRLLVLILVSY